MMSVAGVWLTRCRRSASESPVFNSVRFPFVVSDATPGIRSVGKSGGNVADTVRPPARDRTLCVVSSATICPERIMTIRSAKFWASSM